MRKAIVLGSLGFLFACGGPPVGSKQDAATAAHRASGAGMFGKENKQGLRAADGLEIKITIKGKSGTAKFWFESFGLGELSWSMEFDNFSTNNEDYFTGKITYTLSADVTDSEASVSITCKGNVNMSGEYTSKLDMDVTLTTKIGWLVIKTEEVTEANATISITYTGTVTADGTTYTYDDEPINIAATAATRRQTAGG
jgi:hypothetical protein